MMVTQQGTSFLAFAHIAITDTLCTDFLTQLHNEAHLYIQLIGYHLYMTQI